MSSPTRYKVLVRITHEPNDYGQPRPLPEPVLASYGRETREEAEALVEQLLAAAEKGGVLHCLTAEIHPVRPPSVVAGEILPGGAGAIVGESLADILDLDTWTETRFVTSGPATAGGGGGKPRGQKP